MNFAGGDRLLTRDGLRRAANMIKCDAASVLAVMDVETGGCGFLPDKRLPALFERHVFRRETGGRFDKAAPDLSNATPGGYGPAGAAQYDRLARAMELDERAALRSTSWGLGQIMGFNAGSAGYDDVPDMIAAFVEGEDEQLMAMVRFICHERLDAALRTKNWIAFARGYNGPAYWQHDYDGRLARAYARNAATPLDFALRSKQMQLMFAGLYRARVDGRMGAATRAAMVEAARMGIQIEEVA